MTIGEYKNLKVGTTVQIKSNNREKGRYGVVRKVTMLNIYVDIKGCELKGYHYRNLKVIDDMKKEYSPCKQKP